MLLSSLALAQEVKCSQRCPMGVGNLPVGNHAERLKGCAAAGTSRRWERVPWLAYL